MARTVTIAVSSSTPKTGQRISGRVNVASSDTDPIQVSSVRIHPTAGNSPCRIQQPDLGAGGGAGLGPSAATRQTVINNSGTASFPFDFVAHHPRTPGATAVAYVLNATVTFSDAVIATGAATVTVSPLT